MSENKHTPEPFGYFKAEPFGWTDCGENDECAIPLFDIDAIRSIQKKYDELLKRIKAYQSAWDAKDLRNQLSRLAFEEANGVEFEQAYSEVKKQCDTLLASLENMIFAFDYQDGNAKNLEKHRSTALIAARAAIASVKGGAA